MSFYSSKQDSALVNDFLLQSPDLFISKIEYEGPAVYTTATQLFTVASATWTIDAFISTVGVNIEVVDDNGKLAYGKVTDNTATTVTIVAADLDLDTDGTTAPTLSNGATYQIRIMTPSSVYAYGDFFGYVGDLSFNNEQESAEFKYGIPRELIREDLLENMATLSGTVFSMQNTDVIKSVFGMGLFGLQTGQVSLASGSDSFSNSFYRVALLSTDVNSKAVTWLLHKVKMKPAGEINLSDEGYKGIPFECKVFVDTLRESSVANKWRYIKTA